jgi:hypothetical protein
MLSISVYCCVMKVEEFFALSNFCNHKHTRKDSASCTLY